MNIENVKSLFVLFASESDTEKYLPLIQSAISEVTFSLRSDSDPSDIRLEYLAAAIANLRYTQILAAKDKVIHNKNGDLATNHNGSQQLEFAYALVREYKVLVYNLLDDSNFAFFGV